MAAVNGARVVPPPGTVFPSTPVTQIVPRPEAEDTVNPPNDVKSHEVSQNRSSYVQDVDNNGSNYKGTYDNGNAGNMEPGYNNANYGADGALANNQEKYAQEPDIPTKPPSAYITVCLLCLCVAFGGFVFGWDTGTISGFINHTDYKDRFAELRPDGSHTFSDGRVGLIVSIFNIGAAIGGIILSKLGDMYGRRIGLMIVTLVYVVGIIIQITSSTKWYQYFIGRIVSGMGVGGIAVLSPMLISETSPKHLRGILVSCYQLMITLGIFLGYCANYGTKNHYSNQRQWRIPLGLCFVWAFFMISGMTFVPESPRYLVEVDRVDDARISLAKSNKVPIDDPAINIELQKIQAGVELERRAGNATWGELFSTKTKVLQRVIMGMAIQSLQQLTGNNYFFYYGTTIFDAVGLDDPFQTSIILGLVNFISTFAAFYIVGKFGRRTCLLWGAASMAVCMLIYASIGTRALYPNGNNMPSSKSAGNGMIVFTCFFIFCFATTWAPLAYVIVAETFPLRVKAKGMAIATAANWIWGFLISFFTPFITSAIQFRYGFVFAACLIFAFFYIFFFVPETKGLTLEEVEEMWQEDVLPWNSHKWEPKSTRGANYDTNALSHDSRPWYRRFI
ncbi:HBR345Cp [Eremothecium sinecaudum]|uniref:HBR345Cp n=1 Tax=Eremothecium sinecaudum TaxID=45286 RepID=A0A120K1D6_9SACH|nr:HBR345Cp [Eremothecium sinecaudum]AMD19246.1 HBR345Cp [Eremothecium sinecaudum]